MTEAGDVEHHFRHRDRDATVRLLEKLSAYVDAMDAVGWSELRTPLEVDGALEAWAAEAADELAVALVECGGWPAGLEALSALRLIAAAA
jgi:hypothetical protein